jgi:endonuclease/exonuclease/phosphatase family metal-dependent hydrolase
VLYEALEPTGRLRLRERRQLEVIKDVDADVCFFQECNPAPRRAPEIARLMNADYNVQPDLVGLKIFGLGIPMNLNGGLVITARPHLKLRQIDAISLSRPQLNLVRKWGSWQVREERFALYSEITRPDGARTLLIDTHVHHGLEATPEVKAEIERLGEELALSESVMTELRERLSRGNARRRLEITNLLARLDTFRDRYDAVVLAGDFNVAPGGEVSRILTEYGFRDAWAEINPDDPGFTFDKDRNPANHLLQLSFPLTLVVEDLSFSPRIRDALLELARAEETRPRRIDYVWVWTKTGGARVKRAELVGLPDAEGLAPSDHFGVSTEIEFE